MIDAEVEAFIGMHSDRTNECADGWPSEMGDYLGEKSSPLPAPFPTPSVEFATTIPFTFASQFLAERAAKLIVKD